MQEGHFLVRLPYGEVTRHELNIHKVCCGLRGGKHKTIDLEIKILKKLGA